MSDRAHSYNIFATRVQMGFDLEIGPIIKNIMPRVDDSHTQSDSSEVLSGKVTLNIRDRV